MDLTRKIPGTEQAQLPNGMRLIVTPVPTTYAASVTFFVGVGSRYEPVELSGASHLLEHMVFKGCSRYPTAKDISLAIEGVGGAMNASTGKEYTMYYVKVPYQHLDLAVDVLDNMLRRSLFVEEELNKERGVVVEEIRMNLDNPFDWAHEQLDDVVWPDHPLGRDIAGTQESVLGIPRDRLIDYWHAFYGAPQVVVSIAGRLDAAETIGKLSERLRDWPGGAATSFAPATSGQEAPRVRVARRKTEQAYIALAAKGYRRGDPDRFALQLLNTVLGEGMSSRLFQEVREKRGLAYSVDSWVRLLADTGQLGVSAGVSPNRSKVESALEAILTELNRIAAEPVPEAELASAREQDKGRLQLSTEDSLSIAAWYGQQEALGMPVLMIDDVLAGLERVRAEDVQRVARSLVRPENMSAVVVGSFSKSLEGRVSDMLAGAGGL
jgi:predicted Zn-dependent peptidase